MELGATPTHGAQDRLKHVIRPRLPPLLRALDTEPMNLAALHLIGPAVGRAVLKGLEAHRALDLRRYELLGLGLSFGAKDAPFGTSDDE